MATRIKKKRLPPSSRITLLLVMNIGGKKCRFLKNILPRTAINGFKWASGNRIKESQQLIVKNWVWMTLLVIWFSLRQFCEQEGAGLDDPYECFLTWDILQNSNKFSNIRSMNCSQTLAFLFDLICQDFFTFPKLPGGKLR